MQATESTVNSANLDTETKMDDDDTEFPTLYVAVVFGLEDVVKTLIQNDTDVNINLNDKNGWIALHTACAFGQVSIAEMLLNHGANVNLKDTQGWSPIFVAAASGHEKIVKLLLKYGADIELKNDQGLTPLHGSAEFGMC